MPESHARELAPLLAEPETLREIYSEVQEQTAGKPRAADYREAVDRCLGVERPEPTYIPAPEPAPHLDEIADEHDYDGAVASARLNAQYSAGIVAGERSTRNCRPEL